MFRNALCTVESTTDGTIWKALTSLALGATVGVLVSAPYGQMLGLPAHLCDVLQSATATAALAVLTGGCSRVLYPGTFSSLVSPSPIPQFQAPNSAFQGEFVTSTEL